MIVRKLLFINGLIFCLVSCNSKPKASLEMSENVSVSNINQRSEEVTALSPDEWLVEWNNAYNYCYSQLPPMPAAPITIDPNQDIMEQSMFQPIVDRDQEVEEMMMRDYPDLYSYRNQPEYENKLLKQKEDAYRLIYELAQQNEIQRQQYLEQNQEWLKQFNDNILNTLKTEYNP